MSRRRRRARSEKEDLSSLTARSSPLSSYVPRILTAMEVVLLALVCLTPWAYGSVHPSFEFHLYTGIAVLLALWAARMLVEGQITWKKSAVAICLAGLFLFGVWQRTPLPRPVLSWLSPGTARLYDKLLPERPEVLPNDVVASDATTLPGSTISLYPGATRREAARLLAVFLVFVIVYNNLTSKQTLIRLSWVVLFNGVLLSIFAIAQLFGSPRDMVYWTYASQATPFGPFICHNHFPDYVNISIGLGIGLLTGRSRRDRSSSFSEQDGSLLQILQNPRSLWICAALVLMITAVAFSRSRGGLLALFGAAVLGGVLGWLRLGRRFRLGSVLLVVGLVLALCTWLGVGLVKTRLATLWSGEAYESRLPLWIRTLPIVTEFPIWGTGYGTFGYIEPMYRNDAANEEGIGWFDHAHNDYFEFLIEGGVISLGLVIFALVVVYRRGFRALVVHRGHSEAGLGLGALFGFTALTLHCIGDFGIHIPAITLLGTVICAHLCALGTARPHRSRSSSEDEESPLVDASDPANRDENYADKHDEEREEYRLRLGGVAPILGAAAVLGLGLVLCSGGWRAFRVDRLEEAAFRAGNSDTDQLDKRIACFTEAAALAPENAEVHFELGLAHGRQAELLGAGTDSGRRAALEEEMLALQEYVRARDACPLLSGAQLKIAAYAPRLKQGDNAEDYIRRAKLLIPGQDEMWYLCGLQEMALNHPEAAWATWQHCLELSNKFLPQILSRTRRIRTKLLVEKVLPEKPDVMLAAALQLYPDAGSVEQRRPILEKALEVLEAKSEGQGTQDLLTKARIYKALDEPKKAIRTYREILEREPSKAETRFEFARYLHELRKLEEARRELLLVVAQEPKNDWARGVLDEVMRDMIHGEEPKRQRQRGGWFRR